MIGAADAARLFEAACRAELDALKPGNVHVHAPGHGMEVAHFERAAAAAAGPLCDPAKDVGARIEAATLASLAAAGCNANLGIVLLAAPLLAAAQTEGGDLHVRLAALLDGLGIAEAAAVFRAIAAANPGGLGTAREADVRAPARMGLKAAMALAADRDRVALQYACAFTDVFARGVPVAQREQAAGRAPAQEVYLAFLRAFPDSHVARKHGPAVALALREEAEAVCVEAEHLPPAARHARLLAFDAALKARGLNPGTSADLTVASLLAAALLASGA
ncbi:triphosphoribosyl-dephospho-CoA synthase [Aquabacter spiritensis]|uniref:Triphosphoribosyl-dephospho-CoA synthase n=1 Tax=Aquabacter spiritensis TaxID=933073 RepID=A0A4R3LX15_9HYPH|nr:triphosphoribosyl-dephospho-CoA synthase [Aquabacter spiritensis]TCT04716.1 triphosphoribosyl-dephospho-CoA synthase [Aquabacter spiritensis]